MRSCLVSVAGAIVLLLAPTAASPARADEPAFQKFAGLVAAEVSANLRALRDDFARAPSEAKRLGADIAAALSDGTAVRAVTFALLVVIVGAGLEWLYWTFASAPLRAITATTAATPRQAAVRALRRLALLGFGLLLFTLSTAAAAMTLPWPPNVDVMVIAAAALVVAVRSAWTVVDVIVSPHHASLRLAAIKDHHSGFIVAGVAWVTMLAASAILLPQLFATIGSAPHLAEAIRVGIGGLTVISLLGAVSVIFRRGTTDHFGEEEPRSGRDWGSGRPDRQAGRLKSLPACLTAATRRGGVSRYSSTDGACEDSGLFGAHDQ